MHIFGRDEHDQDDQDASSASSTRQASLLVALLLRYPEIGSVRFEPERASITLSFLLHETPDTHTDARFRERLDRALAFFSRLEGNRIMRHVQVLLRRQGPIAILDIQRDFDSLAVEEFAILMGMVKQSFGDLLIVEGSLIDGSQWAMDDDSSIARGLDQARSVRQGDDLIGFRHDGRVLVFSAA